MQRVGRAQVHQLGGDPKFRLQAVRYGYRRVQRRPQGNDGEVFALALDGGLAQLDLVIPFRHAGCLEHLAVIVDLLALEEDHRVRAGQGGVHHSLGIVRGHRIDHLQARDVIRQGGPILGMLRAVFGPHGNAQHHRHV